MCHAPPKKGKIWQLVFGKNKIKNLALKNVIEFHPLPMKKGKIWQLIFEKYKLKM
jgi:hypothetical protein